MRNSFVSVGSLLAALLAGCIVGGEPDDKSSIQTRLERSETDVMHPPPLESRTAEENAGSQAYEYERGLGAVTEGIAPETRATTSTDGVISAVAHREITDLIPLVVDLYDDSDLDRLILESMIRALLHAGHAVGGHPLFELSFNSHFHAPVYFNKGRDLGKASFGLDMMPSKLEKNVWSSTHDSLVSGRRRHFAKTGRYDFETHASLRERSLDRVVWEGSAVAYVERAKAVEAVPSMVNTLVANLGRDTRREKFGLK
jgi:hypothetical protein